jgi:hypothetical protein
MVGFF